MVAQELSALPSAERGRAGTLAPHHDVGLCNGSIHTTLAPTLSLDHDIRPKAKNLPLIFPPSIYATIVKVDDEAYVTLSFPAEPVYSHLAMDIYIEEVPYIANTLFDIRIHDGGRVQRSVILEHGTTIAINGTLTLSRPDIVALEKLLGKKVSNAVADGPIRIREVSIGELRPAGYTIDMPSEAGLPSRLTLNAAPEQLNLIWLELFKV